MTHRKFLRLCALLRLPVAHVRGILEMVWGVAYEYGDPYLGDRIDVEAAAQWTGEPGVLTRALLECGGDGAGFIEAVADRPDRYQVHDLWDHAPDYVRRRRERELERRQKGMTLAGALSGAESPVSDAASSGADRSVSGPCPVGDWSMDPTRAPAPVSVQAPAPQGIPPALRAGALPDAAAAAMDAPAAPSTPERVRGRGGRWIDLPALSDEELDRVWAKAAKGAERDEQQRRLYYAACHERRRRREGASEGLGRASAPRDGDDARAGPSG